MIFLGLSVIILAERFWSIAFLCMKMRKIKLEKDPLRAKGRKEEPL